MTNRIHSRSHAEATGDSTRVYWTEHDWRGSRPLTQTIHDAISTVDPDHDPTSGLPLYSVIGTGSLEELFAPIDSEYPRDRGRVSFPYQGYTVTVHADGRVMLQYEPPGQEERREVE